MDDDTPVGRRTTEPYTIYDQSSMTSNITYRAIFEERSEVDSLVSTPRNSPVSRKRQESALSEQASEMSRRFSTSERQYDSVEVWEFSTRISKFDVDFEK